MRLTGLWWWIDRWRKSTAYMDMTLEQQGAYRNLLDEAALRGGPLPDDDRVLAKACGDARAWRRVRLAVMARFQRQADGWHNETLDDVIRQSERRATNQRNYRNRLDNAADNGRDNEATNKPDSPDPDPDPDLKSTAASRRPVEKLLKPDKGTFGLYCVIAKEARQKSIDEDQTDSISNIAAIFKALCAQRNIVYNDERAARALATAARS